MSEEKDESKIKEVLIVKRSTKIDSEDYFSIHLKSPEGSMDELIKKAISASTGKKQQVRKKTFMAIA